MAVHDCFAKCLPKDVWCKCGHISGWHSVKHPHVCVIDGRAGCPNQCTGFVAVEGKEFESEGANA